jgi:hypothetical protein
LTLRCRGETDAIAKDRLLLSEDQFAPLQTLQRMTTHLDLGSACSDGALLALDWQLADATAPA